MTDAANRTTGGARAPPNFKGTTMKKREHAFWRCPKCRKEGKLLVEESFIYYHTKANAQMEWKFW